MCLSWPHRLHTLYGEILDILSWFMIHDSWTCPRTSPDLFGNMTLLASQSIVITICVCGAGKAHIYNSFDAFCICLLIVLCPSSIHFFSKSPPSSSSSYSRCVSYLELMLNFGPVWTCQNKRQGGDHLQDLVPDSDDHLPHLVRCISSLLSSHLTKLTIGEGWEASKGFDFVPQALLTCQNLASVRIGWEKEKKTKARHWQFFGAAKSL